MKKINLIAALVFVLTFTSCTETQILEGINTLSGLSSPTNTEIISGLKQALEIGANTAGQSLSASDGFYKNNLVKILFPPELSKVQNTLRDIGMGSLVDAAELKINRAAEDAAKSAAPIFVSAIKSMTINDAVGILKGNKDAATQYLIRTTNTQLYNAFSPTITNSLNKTGALDAWKKVIDTYNKVPLVQKVNPNLSDYVTNQALKGIYSQVAKEELKIRENPAARTTDLLKKVFGSVSK